MKKFVVLKKNNAPTHFVSYVYSNKNGALTERIDEFHDTNNLDDMLSITMNRM